MKLTRKAAPVALASVLALSLAACASSDRDEDSGGDTGGDTNATITFGAAGAPEVFDPFYATDGETFRVTRQLFDNLITTTPGTADIAPSLATEWEPDDSGLNWTFTLRDDVTFTDGEAFNAEAVCANFERMFDQNAASQSGPAEYWAYTMGAFKDKAADSLYAGCEATDETHVVISTTRATSKFPTMLILPSFSMQSPKALTDGDANNVAAQGEGFVYPDYAKNPVGSGPYALESYDEANKTITLVRNEDYWGEKAKNAKLVFRIIPDESTRRQELTAGSINGYDLPNPADWAGLESDGNSVEVRPAFNILYMGLNPANNPKLADLNVRKAIYMALNRDQLVSSQLPDGATVATQMMPDTVAGYNSELEPIAYDPDEAKSLLAAAGATGMTLNFAYPTEVSRPYMPDPQKIYEALRTDLEAVGIKVTVTSKPWNGGYLDGVDAGAFDAWLLGWTGDYNAADNFVGTFFGNLNSNDFNLKAYPWGATLASDLQAADGIVDEGERSAAYETIQQQIQEDYLPALAISHSPPALVIGKGVEGLTASPLTAEEFAPVSIGGN